MATAAARAFSTSEEASGSGEKDAQLPGKSPARIAKKRTKTGCLTCRKRRIKCDELQPTCRNCTKSRRICQYAKYTFKDQPGAAAAAAQQQQQQQQAATATAAGLDPTHPRQGMEFMFAHSGGLGSMGGIQGESIAISQQPIQQHLPPPFAPVRAISSASSSHDNLNYELMPTYNSQTWNPFTAHQPMSDSLSTAGDSASHDVGGVPIYPSSSSLEPFDPHALSSTRAPGTLNTQFDAANMQNIFSSSDSSASSAYPFSAQSDFSRGSHFFSPVDSANSYGNSFRTSNIPLRYLAERHNNLANNVDRRSSTSVTSPTPQRGFMMLSRAMDDGIYGDVANRHFGDRSRALSQNNPAAVSDINEALANAAIEIEDDDYFDVVSEDDEAVNAARLVHESAAPALQIMQSLYHQSAVLHQRGVHAFMYPGIMDEYRAERVASPLKNEATARVFAHFVSSTGPMLSAFERVPRINPALVELGAMPTSHLSLWSFTLPMRALQSQGLLHAMLAMSSLHIARLQSASTTPSYCHYSWSVKRVHKAVGKRKTGHDVSILAATLLLAFYEVMTADLTNWIPHLCGARQLILQIDFGGMAQQIMDRKAERAIFLQSQPFADQPMHAFIDSFPDIDTNFVDMISGKQWQTDCTDQEPAVPSPHPYSLVQLSDFEVLQDLYWWYLKQDMVQSAISGDPPLMHYSHWTRCPPRAPIGQRGEVHGSFDHVILLIGRTCDFSARDVTRKLEWNEANGHPWPKSAFNGMAPAAAAYMPSAYGTTNITRLAREAGHNVRDLETKTNLALQEWTDIESAFDALEKALQVPGYLPLNEDEIGHYGTPFGRVIHYASYNLAVLHMFVLMGRLMHARCHPQMPSAMSVAVAVAASSTAQRAAMIGRIAAGVTPLLSGTANLSAQLAGTFTDCTLPLFFAGVQYRDPAQRYWTVMRLHEIEERSGWASAGLCANGCETAWQKAGEAGVGPPYTRIRSNGSADDAHDVHDVSTGPSSIFEAASRVAHGTAEIAASRPLDGAELVAATALAMRSGRFQHSRGRSSTG